MKLRNLFSAIFLFLLLGCATRLNAANKSTDGEAGKVVVAYVTFWSDLKTLVLWA